MEFIQESLQTPISYRCDVFVAGGGTAGVVAALAAAETGADVILAERNGYLGGTLLYGVGGLHSFFNTYLLKEGLEKKQVVQGIPQRLIDGQTGSRGCMHRASGTENWRYL